MKKRLVLLTGNPRVGKTTLLLRVVEALKAEGYRVGGMLSREVRSRGERIGFEILDLDSGRRGWLAHVNRSAGPRIGRYVVNLPDLDSVGAQAVLFAAENLDVVAIDEIGPMELFSAEFKRAVEKAILSNRLVVGVVHWKSKDKLAGEVKRREDAELFTVTFENRDRLHEEVLRMAVQFLKSR